MCNGKDGGVRTKLIRILLTGALVGALGGVVGAEVTEAPAPQVQSAPPLAAASLQPGKPAWLTPEKEAALVEVRKILKEAREAAEFIESPNSLFADRAPAKALEEARKKLLWSIEDAQLRAGDSAIEASTSNVMFQRNLALAQARYGFINEAIRTVARTRISDDDLLVLVDEVIKGGDIPTASKAMEIALAKDENRIGRSRNRAVVLSLIAKRQHELGDVGAKTTIQKALEAASETVASHEAFLAFVHVGRVQGILGDRAGSGESFRQAILAAKTIYKENAERAHAFRAVAKAQIEAGDVPKSVQTFQEAIDIASTLSDFRTRTYVMGCVAWSQVVSGSRSNGLKTFYEVFKRAESLPVKEKTAVLKEIGLWQIEAGEEKAVIETIQSIQKFGGLDEAKLLAIRAGYLKLAMDIDASTPQSNGQRAGSLRFIVQSLVKTKDPAGTPEVFQRLVRQAVVLLEKPPSESERKIRGMLSDVALVQTGAGDIQAALSTVSEISSETTQGLAYSDMVQLLVETGNLVGAREVVSILKDEWLPWTSAFHSLGVGYGRLGNFGEGLVWIKQQQNAFAKSTFMLGVAEGLMERHGIVNILRQVPIVPLRDRCPSL